MRVIRPALRAASHAQHTKTKCCGSSPRCSNCPRFRAEDQARLNDLRAWAATSTLPDRSRRSEATRDGSEAIVAPPSVRDRPADLEAMVGQADLLRQLRMVIAGSRLRGVRMVHVLLEGPPGHGKTSLGAVIAQEIGAELLQTTGMLLKKPADLAGLLVKAAAAPTVLFVDEIHSASKLAMECLYTVLEDARIDLIAGSGMDAVAYSQPLPQLVVVGATTRPGLLSEPLRQRFGYVAQLDSYSVDELAEIVRRSWDRVGVTYAPDEPLEVARRSRGIPRRALTLGERVLDYVAVNGFDGVEEGIAGDGLAVFGIDSQGLDEIDYALIDCLVNKFPGQTVGLDSLSASLDLDQRTISDDHEPWLIRCGYLARRKSGRMALPAAYELLREAS